MEKVMLDNMFNEWLANQTETKEENNILNEIEELIDCNDEIMSKVIRYGVIAQKASFYGAFKIAFDLFNEINNK